MGNELRIDISSFSKEVESTLKNYTNEVIEVVEESAEITQKEMVKKLKEISPKGKRGKYSKGWKVKKVKGNLGISYIIYNSEAGLTHLLNNGHAIANQHGKYKGRVKGDGHISKAEEYGKNIFIEEINKRLK